MNFSSYFNFLDIISSIKQKKIYQNNCSILSDAMKKCAEEKNSTIRGNLDIGDGKTPMYYDCILHKDNFNYSTKKKITFSTTDIQYPYNRYYTITNVDGNIEIKLDD
jgi:hypothetical protein